MRFRILAPVALALIVLPVAAHAQCEWQPGFDVSDLDQSVSALVVFDDGSGPELYAGGFFLMANGERVNGIARWDGSGWHPVGEGFGVSDYLDIARVKALAVFNGELYAGGFIDSVGGAPVNGIARWDGSTWSALGDGVVSNTAAGTVYSMAVFDAGGGAARDVG